MKVWDHMTYNFSLLVVFVIAWPPTALMLCWSMRGWVGRRKSSDALKGSHDWSKECGKAALMCLANLNHVCYLFFCSCWYSMQSKVFAVKNIHKTVWWWSSSVIVFSICGACPKTLNGRVLSKALKHELMMDWQPVWGEPVLSPRACWDWVLLLLALDNKRGSTACPLKMLLVCLCAFQKTQI